MKRRRDKTWIYLIIALIPFLFIAFVLIYNLSYLNKVRAFSEKFSNSISFSQENNCLRAENLDVSTRITYRNADAIIKEINGGGIYKYEKSIPTENGIVLDFGNGDIMKIWSMGETGLVICYTPQNGTEEIYSTGESARYINIERLISVKWNNPLWSE